MKCPCRFKLPDLEFGEFDFKEWGDAETTEETIVCDGVVIVPVCISSDHIYKLGVISKDGRDPRLNRHEAFLQSELVRIWLGMGAALLQDYMMDGAELEFLRQILQPTLGKYLKSKGGCDTSKKDN